MRTFFWLALSCYSLALTAQNDSVPYAWLEGSWIGDGFGGTSEEVWSGPSKDGLIVGTYRHFTADGQINFYEMFLLDSTGLRLKHFNPDFSGWEEKEDFLHFKMVECTEDKIVLKGLVYERISDTEMEIRLDMKTDEGLHTEVFKMKRI